MNATFENFRTLFNEAEENATKFFTKGNKSAGTRLRKNMSEMAKLAKQVRVEVTAAKNEQA